MEMSSWLSEMGLEDLDFIDEFQMMDTFGDSTPEQLGAAFGEDNQHTSSDSPPSYSTFNQSLLELEANQTCFEKPSKLLKTADGGISCTTENISTPEDAPISEGTSLNKNYTLKTGHRKKRAIAPTTKPESHTHDHIIAERKRREKLSQQFIALSAIVPGLKKMDKASVLGDTIEYLKELQERVKTFEEQSAKKTGESLVFVKKIHVFSEDDTSTTDENATNASSEPLPEIEARVYGKSVLIRIHCEKEKGVLGKALDAIEELNLSVVNSSIMPFGTSTLDITVVAQMDEELSLSVKNLLNNLRSSFCKFM